MIQFFIHTEVLSILIICVSNGNNLCNNSKKERDGLGH